MRERQKPRQTRERNRDREAETEREVKVAFGRRWLFFHPSCHQAEQRVDLKGTLSRVRNAADRPGLPVSYRAARSCCFRAFQFSPGNWTIWPLATVLRNCGFLSQAPRSFSWVLMGNGAGEVFVLQHPLPILPSWSLSIRQQRALFSPFLALL